jgi:hypothetical protein
MDGVVRLARVAVTQCGVVLERCMVWSVIPLTASQGQSLWKHETASLHCGARTDTGRQ